MGTFSLDDRLAPVYAQLPEAHQRPLVAITSNYTEQSAALVDRYYKQVVDAGGTPVIMPPVADTDVIVSTLDHVDALLLTGGADINPLWQGEDPVPQLSNINAERDGAELITMRLAFNRQMPVLGICRGIQTMVTALGGKVCQDISTTQKVKHSQEAERYETTHIVDIDSGSELHALYNVDRMAVNSFHHQVVETPGKRFVVTARSADGLIEAVESSEHKPLIGVQWHPEWLGEDGLKLFKWLVDEAALYRKTKFIHRNVVVFDSHCDTPMFFHQGIDFAKRDDRILVDLHKMTDGRQDAVTMAAYLPQPLEGKTFQDVVKLKADGPKQYADLIFDKIEDIISSHPFYVAKATCRDDILRNKWGGRKSILLAIENGLALENDIDNVAHFARRGVTYITLCHNGDNDICDSARRTTHTHGGVSEWGAKVIGRMNKEGVLVDLSHAAENSFYDAIDISQEPVACSHSNSRALCDVERNLTDDQMRALARTGGVAQVTFYKGFLRTGSEASVLDALAHLDHAIKIMGVDHVGIGTDFDGDGGVPGMADSSELLNFTRHLLRKRYNMDDIEKIWGGNWLRLLDTVRHKQHA